MKQAFSREWTVSKPAVQSTKGMVAAQNQKAARVGRAILEDGGNAVDAAIATSLALAATEPWMSGLGGGGCMIVHIAAERKTWAVDFGMVAPRGLDPADYPLTDSEAGDLFGWPGVVDDRNLVGPLSVCVPTQLAGLGEALARFGSRPLAELIAPAAALAREGLGIDWYASLLIGSAARQLARYPASRDVWLPDGFPPVPDWQGKDTRLPLGRLADTLDEVGRRGVDGFYRGDLAHQIVQDVQQLGGRLQQADMEAVHPQIQEALAIPYRDGSVFAMPGLFAGVTLGRCLETLSGRPLTGTTPDADAYLAYAQALNAAYKDRLEQLGDSAPGQSCTSHLCVVDRHGNLVSLTQTLLSLFGSKVVLPSTGLLMNNGVMWFDPSPGHPNSIAPGKRPLSNMCPVVAQIDDRHFAIGASGGRRILPAVLQLTSFLLDYAMDLEAAFHQPRIDASGTPLVTVDGRLSQPVKDALTDRLATAEAMAAVYPLNFACPTAVMCRADGGQSSGAAEPSQPWAGAQAER